MRVVVDVSSIERGIRKIIENTLKKTALIMEAKAVELCPVDTGRLRNSIYSKFEEDRAVVGTNVEYAEFVEYGTRAHTIRPKTKKALRFDKDGKEIIVKKVHHPGTKSRPFLRPALERGRSYFLEELARECR